MKKAPVYMLLLLFIAMGSCKKEKTPVPQQTIRLIDYDTRQGIAEARLNIMKDEMFNAILGTALVPTLKQVVQTDAVGFASFELVDGGYVFMNATGYLQRRLSMQFAKGEQEMLKSAKIELELKDEQLAVGTVSQIRVSLKPDPQLGITLGESLALKDTTLPYPSGAATIQLDGIAGKQNGLKISVSSDTIKDTVIWVNPTLNNVLKVQFKY